MEQLVAELPLECQETIFAELIFEEVQLRKMRGDLPALDEYL